MHPLTFIVGVTAVGKTDLGFQLADKNSGGVLNSDSLQVYKELNIGTAKPDFNLHPNTPHFLFNIIQAPHLFTAGNFRREALSVCKEELLKRPLFIVGGSGFYIQALEKGMYSLKPISLEIKKQLEEDEKSKGISLLYKELQEKDPEVASSISPKDKYRIVRTLSIIRNEKKSLSQIQKDFVPNPLPWKYKKIGLDISKEDLLGRVKLRVKKMLKEGLLEEIEALIQKGYEQWRPLSSLGYKEGLSHLKGDLTKEELFLAIVKNTMAYAKRQKTWFKRDSSIQWYPYKEKALKINQDFF